MSTRQRRGSRPRRSPRGLLGPLVTPVHGFLAGALLIPAFLFQVNLPVRVLQVLLFMGLALLSGRRLRPANLVGLSAGIVLMNLLIPFGKVLFSVGPLPVTLGALQSGLLKATTVAGLLYLSLFSIRSDLPLPGLFGGLVGRVIWYFERILETPKRLERRDLIGSLDRLLVELSRPDPPEPQAPGEGGGGAPAARTTPAGWLLLLALVGLNWGVLFLVPRG